MRRAAGRAGAGRCAGPPAGPGPVRTVPRVLRWLARPRARCRGSLRPPHSGPESAPSVRGLPRSTGFGKDPEAGRFRGSSQHRRHRDVQSPQSALVLGSQALARQVCFGSPARATRLDPLRHFGADRRGPVLKKASEEHFQSLRAFPQLLRIREFVIRRWRPPSANFNGLLRLAVSAGTSRHCQGQARGCTGTTRTPPPRRPRRPHCPPRHPAPPRRRRRHRLLQCRLRQCLWPLSHGFAPPAAQWSKPAASAGSEPDEELP